MKKTGIELITEERCNNQIEKHGFTLEHDKQNNTHGELIDAAIFLLSGDCDSFPIAWDKKWWDNFSYYVESDSIKAFTVAGALIAAEIDRLQALKEE